MNISDETYYTLISSYTQTTVILLTGLFVFVIYNLTKNREIRNAARVIYLEIKNSEQRITELKSTGFATEETIIMPTNSWEKHSHLFMSKLDFEDYFIIDSYYASCAKVQEMLDEIKKYHDISILEKGIYLQKKLIDLVDVSSTDTPGKYRAEKEKLLNIAHEENYFFTPHFPRERLGKYLGTIRPIIGTTCFDKIKNISGIR